MVRVLAAVLLAGGCVCAQSLPGSARGAVRDQSGAPIPGVAVELTRENGQIRKARSDALGEYRFPELVPDTYRLRLEFPGFFRFERAGVVVAAGSETLLAEATLMVVNPSLSIVFIGGTVVDATGAPLDAVTVTAVDAPQQYSATTRANGSFVLSQLNRYGTYPVTASKPGYRSTTVAGRVFEWCGYSGPVPDSALRITLPVAGRTGAAGIVRDGTGAPIPDAEAEMVREGGQVRKARSDAKGVLRFPDLKPGTYALRVAYPGFRRFERAGIVVADGVETPLEATLVREKVEPVCAGSVAGEVVDASGVPLAAAEITAAGQGGARYHGASGAGGRFILQDAGCTESYEVTFFKQGYRPARISYKVDKSAGTLRFVLAVE